MRRIIDTYRDAYAGLPRDVWMLSAVALVNRMGTMVLAFLTLWLTTTHGFSIERATGMLSIYGLGSMLGAYIGGALTDRIGAVTVQATSLATGGVALFALGTMTSETGIAVALFVYGVLADAFRPANAALMAALSPPGRVTQAFALNRLAVNLGMAIGPAMGGFLALVGYGWLFIVDGTTYLLAAALFIWAFAGRSTDAKTDADETAPAEPRGPFRDRVFLASIGLALIVACIFMQSLGTMPLYLERHYGMREDAIGLLFAINPILITLFEMVIAHRLARPNPLRLVALAALLTGIGFALLPLGATFLFGAFAVTIWTIGEMLDGPFLGGFVANRAPAAARGRYMAIYTMVFSAAMVLGPELGGRIWSRFGPETLWFTCGIAGVVACIGYLIVARRVDAERYD